MPYRFLAKKDSILCREKERKRENLSIMFNEDNHIAQTIANEMCLS
jgi:hypothetical protein